MAGAVAAPVFVQLADARQRLIEVSGLPEDDAIAVLHAFNWDVEEAIAVLLDNPDATKKKVGPVPTASTRAAASAAAFFGGAGSFIMRLTLGRPRLSTMTTMGRLGRRPARSKSAACA